MGTINTTRVIIGGIVAGLVINASESLLNGVVLSADMEAMTARMNLPPIAGQAIAVFMILGFALGITMVWLYAAMRARFGAGPKTALCTGAAVWFLAYVYPTIGFAAMQMFSMRLVVISLVWGLVELLVASVAGAALYKE